MVMEQQSRKKPYLLDGEGYWRELNDNYHKFRYYSSICQQKMYQGEYQNSKKIGLWTIQFWGECMYQHQQQFLYLSSEVEENIIKLFKEMANGQNQIMILVRAFLKPLGKVNIKKAKNWQMDNLMGKQRIVEVGLKNGQWIDLIDNFHGDNEITLQGEYRDGKNDGRCTYQLDKQQIGGGSYNQQGQKRGQWIELSDDFFNDVKQVSFKGSYKNKKKVGKWIEKKGRL